MTWQEEKFHLAEELEKEKNLSKKEPAPIKNNNPAVWDLVIKDIEDRRQIRPE